MTIILKYFGLIVDITNKNEEHLQLDQETISMVVLKSIIESRYQSLQNTTYAVALNQTICATDIEIKSQDIIAFLPPFAGG